MHRRLLIIDGYNVIGALSILRGNRLAHDRAVLLERLSRYSAVRGHHVIVVFDGLPGGHPDHPRAHPGVEARFSGMDEKADPVIVRLARQAHGECVVVSDDHGVRRPCEHSGAVVLHATELDRVLSRSEREPVPAPAPAPARPSSPPPRPAAAPPIARMSDADKAAWEAFTVGVTPLPTPASPSPANSDPPAPAVAPASPDPVPGVPGGPPADAWRPDPEDPWEVPDSVIAAKDADEELPSRADRGPSRDERRRRHILDDL